MTPTLVRDESRVRLQASPALMMEKGEALPAGSSPPPGPSLELQSAFPADNRL